MPRLCVMLPAPDARLRADACKAPSLPVPQHNVGGGMCGHEIPSPGRPAGAGAGRRGGGEL
jgi:hypothetical protein